MHEGMHIGLLDNILRLRVVIQDGASDSIEPLVVTFDDEPEGSCVALLGTFDQRRVIQIFNSLCPDRCDCPYHGISRCDPQAFLARQQVV